MPWHQGACVLLMDSHARQGNEDKMWETLADCRGYFPSDYLRPVQLARQR